jgi:hypothetical protein
MWTWPNHDNSSLIVSYIIVCVAGYYHSIAGVDGVYPKTAITSTEDAILQT